MNPTQEAAAWLANEDAVALPERVARLEWSVRQYPAARGFVLTGGWVSKQLLEEAKYCYVYGQFVAVAVLGVAFIDRVIAAELYAAGRDDLERTGGLDLLREALKAGWLPEADFQRFNTLRQLRHPLVHFRRPLGPGTLERRAVQDDSDPATVL